MSSQLPFIGYNNVIKLMNVSRNVWNKRGVIGIGSCVRADYHLSSYTDGFGSLFFISFALLHW